MSLLDLPNELLLSIAGSLRCVSGIRALVCANRRLYVLLNAYLQEYHIQISSYPILPWATYHRITNAILKFLELEANLQATFEDKKTHNTGPHSITTQSIFDHGSPDLKWCSY
jgi:hypothetical protein